jgi:hypothetical protein
MAGWRGPGRRGLFSGIAAGLITVSITAGLLGAPAMAQTQAQSRNVSGRLVMGTSGAALPSDLVLSLVEVPTVKGGQVARSQLPVAPGGSFNFEAAPGKKYVVGTIYQGVTYAAVVDDSKTGSVVTLEIKLFETTKDVSVVSIVSDTTTAIDGKDGALDILQLQVFENRSDRTFVGTEGDSRVLKLPVPEGAFDVAAATEDNPMGLAQDGGVLAATSPLLPGQTSIAYVYRVRAPRTGWQLRREFYYPTRRADILLGADLMVKAAPDFKFAERKTLGGRTYSRHRGGPFQPGAVLGADIVFANGGTGGLWWGLAVALGLVAAGTGGGLWLRRSSRRKAAEGPAGPSQPRAQDRVRRSLVEEIADLDERFDQGAVEEAAYQSERGEMMGRLQALTHRQQS